MRIGEVIKTKQYGQFKEAEKNLITTDKRDLHQEATWALVNLIRRAMSIQPHWDIDALEVDYPAVSFVATYHFGHRMEVLGRMLNEGQERVSGSMKVVRGFHYDLVKLGGVDDLLVKLEEDLNYFYRYGEQMVKATAKETTSPADRRE